MEDRAARRQHRRRGTIVSVGKEVQSRKMKTANRLQGVPNALQSLSCSRRRKVFESRGAIAHGAGDLI